MRFDDSLATVLAADADSGFGAEAAWRQLVDLVGRGRVPDVTAAIARLRGLRDHVPGSVRAASARALALADPPAALVALFAEDEIATAALVVRAARLDAAAWVRLLPRLTPGLRAVLRHRRDLPDAVVRGLASFGATDFVLGFDGTAADPPGAPAADPPPPVEPALSRAAAPAPFVAVGDVARALPVVEEALRQSAAPPRSEIADLVARIEAFRREQPAQAPASASPPPERFDFHTDAAGVIRWVEGAARGPLIGVSLASHGAQGAATVAPAAATAWRARNAFRDVRLDVAGDSSAAGAWLLSGGPRFDPASRQFTGMAGCARRPYAAAAAPDDSTADTLRQLVHELRTPANAVAGFSELIGTAMLGPVPPVYRERAQLISRDVGALTAAIEDLDLAARLDAGALDLRADQLDLAPVLGHVSAAVQPLARERGVALTLEASTEARVGADAREVARLIDRLLVAVLSAATPGEQLRVQLVRKTRSVRLHVTRPRALEAGDDDAAPPVTTEAAGLLLGAGFTLRLVRNLATALGGTLQVSPDRLTLRLPAAETAKMEQAAAQ